MGRTGGPKLAEKISTSNTLQEATEKASDWFCSQACLFLVDNIWKVDGIDSDVVSILGSMVNHRSRLVYTTRDKHFLDRVHKVITFEDKEVHGELAQRMLMRHGGFDDRMELEGKNKGAVEAILEECQGLPVFGIAGGVVFKRSWRKSEGRRQDAWCDFYDDTISKTANSPFCEISAEAYGGLNRIVDVSLDVAGAQCVDVCTLGFVCLT